MKGIILAGGTGSRLYPCTKVTNKHLLPVYDRPMIYYPIMAMIKAGIEDILIISSEEHAGDFEQLLGGGKDFIKDFKKLEPTTKEFNINFTYRIQSGPNGIADGLKLAEDFVGNEKCVVILGDNVFLDDISEHVKTFEKSDNNALICLKEIPKDDLYGDIKGIYRARFGVAEVENGKLIKVIEKPMPKDCNSNLVVIGIYMFPPDVFEKITKLKPSWRGEYEITDVNQMYIDEEKMQYGILKGFWSDAGTIKTLNKASRFVEKNQRKE